MTPRAKGLAVLAVQVLLVLSITAKYAWERHTCPRVWTRTAQIDPESPLRGRYLALSLTADACALPLDKATPQYVFKNFRDTKEVANWQWAETAMVVRKGILVAQLPNPNHPENSMALTLRQGLPCEHASLQGDTEFYLSEHAKSPFPLAKGDQLWAEVTVPAQGPPRPIQLAVSNGKQFKVLDLR